jgi:hypothetical protein
VVIRSCSPLFRHRSNSLAQPPYLGMLITTPN